MRCSKMSIMEWNAGQPSVKFCTRWSVLFSFRQRKPSPVFSLIYVIIIHVISSWRSELQTSDLPRCSVFQVAITLFWKQLQSLLACCPLWCGLPGDDLQSSLTCGAQGRLRPPLDSNVWTQRAAATLAWHQPLISDDRRETVRDKIIFPSPPSPPTLLQRNARTLLLLFLPRFPKR